MIFNCLHCGKAISSTQEVCPYCRIEISDISLELHGIKRMEERKKILKERYKGTIFSFGLR